MRGRSWAALAAGIAVVVGATWLAWTRWRGASEGPPGVAVERPGSSRLDGPALFHARCSGCHGDEGRGDGPAAAHLVPRPRDFTRGLFKLGTTGPDQLPSDADLARVIAGGINGSAMHLYGELADEEVQALVARVKELSVYVDDTGTSHRYFDEEAEERVALEPGLPPDSTPGRLALGEKLFRANCATCHGAGGTGDGPSAPTLKDAWGNPLSPRNLTIPLYKGGATVRDIFVRVTRGIPGTPMPAFDSFTERQRWAMASFVRSLQRWPPRLTEQGAALFRAYGCVSCHGPGGRGGIPNPNYVGETVPVLATLAERMFLFEREDAEAFTAALEKADDPAALATPPDIPRWRAVLAQYRAVRGVIEKGSRAGPADPQGEAPPLNMPAWGDRLTPRDINAVVAYLVSLQTWEEDE